MYVDNDSIANMNIFREKNFIWENNYVSESFKGFVLFLGSILGFSESQILCLLRFPDA